ncbi:hypothetical protein BDZ89DRAFT_1082877 [Hymenopellis radicata]|nr:hypothetical protein BDZ89DRAFT_1082877 [Hymenopellis radicata]
MSPTAVDKDTTLALSLIHLHELPRLRENRALLPSPDLIFNLCLQHDLYRSISGARDVIEKCKYDLAYDTYRKPAARRRPKLLFGESRGERRPKSKPRQRARQTSTRSSTASAITPSAPASMSNQSSLLLSPLSSLPIDDATSILSAEPPREHPFTSSKLAEDGKIVVTGDSAKEIDCPAKGGDFPQEQSEEVASVVQDAKKDTC